MRLWARGIDGCLLFHLPTHRDTRRIAPHPHLRIAHAVDGFVSPLRERGGRRGGVFVVGRGVVGQEDEAFAVAAVHLEFQHVEGGAVAAPAPADFHAAAAEEGGEEGLDARQVRPGLHRADDAEGLLDGVGTGGG